MADPQQLQTGVQIAGKSPDPASNVIAPTTGENPLSGAPPTGWGTGEWQGPGGGQKAKEYHAWNDFYNLFHRNPTQSELNLLSSAYAGDPNQVNSSQGAANIAQYFQSQAGANTPDKVYAEQQAKYLAAAPKYADQVNGLFQSQLGRTATQDELNHFGSQLASGTVDNYQLQQFLQQQPEYQTQQNAKMRSGLSDTMAANDKRQFSEQILPSIQEAYAKQGRSFDSSAFANSATQSAQAQNTNREAFLSNLTAQQYGGVQQNAYNDYANQVQQQQNLTNSGIQAQYGGIQNSLNRGQQIQDYNTQQQAYNQYLARYGKSNSGMQGAAAGAGAGATIGTGILPGWGTAIGAGVGAIGGYFGSKGGSY